LTDRRAKELLRGVAAHKAESKRRLAIKAAENWQISSYKTQKAKAMVQGEAHVFLKAKSARCVAEGCRRSPLKTKQPSSQASCHQPTLPVLLGKAGFLAKGRELPLHENQAKGTKKEVYGSSR
jgi:hypothetical protein